MPAKKPDSPQLPAYPTDPPALRDYFRELTQSLQWTLDQLQAAVTNGVVPWQSSTFASTISPGATGVQVTFTAALQSTSFSVVPTTHWNAGATWITATSVNGFQIAWAVTPSSTTSIDYLIHLGVLPA